MKLKLIIDKLEDVPEQFRELYVEKDGQFHLDADVPDNSGALRTELAKVKREAAERRRLTEKYEKLGKTPEEIEEALAELAKNEEDKLTSKGKWDELKAQMVEKHTQALSAKDKIIGDQEAQIKGLTSSFENYLVEAKATEAIVANKGVPTLLLPHVKQRIKAVKDENTNGYDFQVVDEKGNLRVNGKGEPLPIADFVLELKGNDTFGRAFEGSGHAGGGTPPGGGGGRPLGGVTKRSEFKTEKERAAFVDAHGVEAYQKLPA